jgi:DNA invertase Pin-like site-specific DNA recombinase
MMNTSQKVTTDHLRRLAYLYVRQSSLQQVHDHRESTVRQYDLKGRAQALGWTADRIQVIDEDQGLSGASAIERDGFQRLVADVGLGRVGLVMGLEVSRLARNSSDWHRLLEICALTETLILDEDGVYDPAHFNDRLLLGLKGTMSEAELHVLRARLIGGQMNKARRGELWMKPPIGFVVNTRGQLTLDPDAHVQHTVRLLFDTFRRTGSAGAVVRHFQNEGLTWPRHLVSGPRPGTLVFGPLGHSRVLGILHNPRYTGAYVYGRTRQRKVRLPGQMRYRRLPREEWKVFLPDVHPRYLTWDEYEANQKTLRHNAHGYGSDRRRSPPREGVALLQGLVVCGRCGDRMTVRYETHQGHPAPVYACQRRGIETATPACQMIHGAALDAAISDLVLAAVTPASVDVALEVFDELRTREADLDRARRAQVARAREDAELAQRQFFAVRPEHRLVADTLERDWNDALRRLAQAEDDYQRASEARPKALTADMREQITGLVADLPRVWHDPRTPARERKRILRLLIEDVTLMRDDVIRMSIRWKGGATAVIERPLPLGAPDLRRTPADIVEQVRALATEQTDGQIARTLNHRWLRTGTGQAFTSVRVHFVRYTYDIQSYADHLQRAGWLTADQIAQTLQVHPTTAKKFAHAGILHAVRADDKGTILFEPPTGPLPTAQPGKRLRDRGRYPPLSSDVRKGLQYEA